MLFHFHSHHSYSTLPPQWELRLDPKPPGDYSHSLSYGFKAVKVLHIYQEILLNPHQLLTKIMNALLLIVIYLQCTFRSIVISRQVLKYGLSSLDSQTAMARIGCVTMVGGGMTNTLPLEQRMTLLWYHSKSWRMDSYRSILKQRWQELDA